LKGEQTIVASSVGFKETEKKIQIRRLYRVMDPNAWSSVQSLQALLLQNRTIKLLQQQNMKMLKEQ